MPTKKIKKAAETDLEKAQRPDDEKEGKKKPDPKKEEEMEYEDKEEGEEEEKSCAKKSEDLTEDDLEKSLGKLTDFVVQEDAPTRKQVLLEKAQESELTKSELVELNDILGSKDTQHDDQLSQDISKAMEPSDDLQKALDVSDFLSETHEENKRVATMLAERIEKSDARQTDFNIVSAKALVNIGKLVKSASELIKSVDSRLADIENQPARPAKSKVRPLQKSFANSQTSDGEVQLSKAEIIDTLGEEMRKSIDSGQNGMVEGIDLGIEVAKYENTGLISPRALEIVKRKRSAVQ